MKKILLFLIMISPYIFGQTGTWSFPKGYRLTIFKTTGIAQPSNILCEIRNTDSVYVANIHSGGNHYEVIYQDQKGYIRTFELVENNEMQKMKDALFNNWEEKVDSLKHERWKIYNKTWGKSIANKILAEKIWIGMTAEMCSQSRGEPASKSKTVSEYSILEIWQYEKDTLFFENGKLKRWTENN